jgi:hypothetical protein
MYSETVFFYYITVICKMFYNNYAFMLYLNRSPARSDIFFLKEEKEK